MTAAATENAEPTRREAESSLATKIILLVFLSTFLSAAVLSWIAIETARRQLWTQIREAYPALLEQSGQHLLRGLTQGRSLTADVATRRGSREVLLRLVREAGMPSHEAAERALFRSVLAPLAERSREIADFVLLTPDGRAIGDSESADALSPEQRAALAQAGGPLFHTLLDRDGATFFATSVPVLAADDSSVAQLVGIFRTDALRELLASERFGSSTRLDVLDAEGHAVIRAGEAGDRADPEVTQAAPSLEGIRDYTGPGGEHVIGLARPLGALGWTLSVEAPYDQAFAPVLAVLQRLLLIDVCVVALASLLAYLITSSIVRPIEALCEGARRIASGRFDLELPETGREDELGLLTRTFNEMVCRLRRGQADLESVNRRLRDQNQSLQASNEILEQLSITDGLTKLHNHRFFQDHLTREIKRANRTGEPLSVVLVDIDDFKRLNDRLGHAAGDELLQALARVLSESVRDSDLLARYGGEEFAIVASGTDLAGAAILAEKIRGAVAEKPFTLDDAIRPLGVTVSAGVAQYKGDRKKFFAAADQALYRAKADGKNRVRVAE